jgi:hypothetical protein
LTTPIGELGLLCMAGTGGKPEQRCIKYRGQTAAGIMAMVRKVARA